MKYADVPAECMHDKYKITVYARAEMLKNSFDSAYFVRKQKNIRRIYGGCNRDAFRNASRSIDRNRRIKSELPTSMPRTRKNFWTPSAGLREPELLSHRKNFGTSPLFWKRKRNVPMKIDRGEALKRSHRCENELFCS